MITPCSCHQSGYGARAPPHLQAQGQQPEQTAEAVKAAAAVQTPREGPAGRPVRVRQVPRSPSSTPISHHRLAPSLPGPPNADHRGKSKCYQIIFSSAAAGPTIGVSLTRTSPTCTKVCAKWRKKQFILGSRRFINLIFEVVSQRQLSLLYSEFYSSVAYSFMTYCLCKFKDPLSSFSSLNLVWSIISSENAVSQLQSMRYCQLWVAVNCETFRLNLQILYPSLFFAGDEFPLVCCFALKGFGEIRPLICGRFGGSGLYGEGSLMSCCFHAKKLQITNSS